MLRMVSIAAIAALVLSTVGTTGGAATAAATPLGRETVAALDPALVAGRGAAVAFLEQEAENAATNGTVIGPDRPPTRCPPRRPAARRSSSTPGPVRRVHAAAAGERDHRALQHPGRAGGRRHHRAARRDGQRQARRDDDAHLAVRVALQPVPVHQRPERRPAAPGLVDHRVRVRAGGHDADAGRSPSRSGRCTSTTSSACCSAGPTRPATRSGSPRRPAAAPRGPSSTCSTPSSSARRTCGSSRPNVLLFGADPTGRRDSADAFDKAIAFAEAHRLKVYVPPGTYQVNRHIIVDDVTIEGAGNWYTIIKGREVALDRAGARTARCTPASASTARTPRTAAARNVHLSGFAIEGDVRERIDTDQVNGIGGAMSDSTIDGLYIQPHQGRPVVRRPDDERRRSPNNIIVDQIADALNFHTGVTNSVVREQLRPQHRRRRPGDVVGEDRRTRATRSTTTPCRRRRWPTASRIYGGTDNTVSNNLVADPIREGSGIHVGSRFGAEPFAGHAVDHRQHHGPRRHVRAELEHRPRRDLDLRAGQEHRRGHPGDRRPLPRQHLQRDHAGQRLAGEGPVLDHQRPLQGHPGRRHGHLGAQRPGRRVGASFENVDARNVGAVGVNNCGSFNFTPDRLGVLA